MSLRPDLGRLGDDLSNEINFSLNNMKMILEKVPSWDASSNKGKGTLNIDSYPKYGVETSDSPRIQRLFDDLGVKGNRAEFSPGVYTLDSEVVLSGKQNVEIIGMKNAVIKRASKYTGNMLKLNQCSGLMFKGLQVDTDDGFGTPAKVTGTYNADNKTYTVDSTANYNSTGSFYVYTTAGIQSVTYTGKTATSFTGCTNYGVIGGGMLSSPVTTGSDIRPIYKSPLALIGVSDIDITQCTFTGNFNHAGSDMVSMEAIGDTTTAAQGYKTFVATTPVNNVKIYQNTFKNSGEEAVIWRNGCSNVAVNNNYFENIWGTGVTNKGNNSQVNYNTFVNCYIGTEVNAEASILTQGNDGTVKGNRFYGCGVAVFMQTTGTPLEDAGRYVSTFIVEDNEIYNSTFCAIYGRHGKEAIIKNNRIEGVKVVADPRTPPYGAGNGIYLFNVNRSQVEGNTVSDCDNDHIYIDTVADAKVKHNVTRQGGLLTRTKDATTANSAIYTVESTTGYPDAGTFKVLVGGAEQTITYTGRTATSFTGCTGGDTTGVIAGSYIRSAGGKRHIYLLTCNDFEFEGNKTANGYIQFHSARNGEILYNKVVNCEATSAILVTGDSVRNRINYNRITYCLQYAIRLGESGRTQDRNEVKGNTVNFASVGANGGTSAIQLAYNTGAVVNDNHCFTNFTNKPSYGVDLQSSVSGSVAKNNTTVGSTGSVPNRDWNTTTPNQMESVSVFGTVTYSATGSLGSYSFDHGLNPMTPKRVAITLASVDAGTAGIKYVTADATKIYIYFNTQPVAGTNNITFNWEAKL